MKNPFIIQKDRFFLKERKIKNYSSKKIEGEEWLGDSDNKSLKRIISYSRVFKVFFIIFLGIFILFFRLVYLQIIKGDYYRKVAEGNRIRIEEIKAPRGLIYDRNQNPLVKNIPSFYLAVIPSDLPKDEEKSNQLLNKIAEIFDNSTRENLEKIIKENNYYSYQPIIIKENIALEKAILLKIESNDLPGIKVKSEGRRQYLGDFSLSHILGYLGRITSEEWADKKNKDYALDDFIGKTGLEFYYEDLLKGKKGKQQIEVDSTGKEKEVLHTTETQVGESLVLSIDLELQKRLAQSLQKNITRIRAKKGVAIALNPQNGEILALVSFPYFDNNLFIQGLSQEEYQQLANNPNQPLFFRAISGEYPPGSTIKPLIALAALEEGIISRWTKINSLGGIRIDKWFFPDWKAGGHGLTDVKKALAESVNTFFYLIGGGYGDFKGLGLAKINIYLKKFGLSQKIGIDLSGEKKGFLPTSQWKEKVKNEKWYIGDTYHLAIGQGDILVTPLQVANFTAMIANGGKLYKPHLVKEIIKPNPEIIEKFEPDLIESISLKQENINLVQQGLREAVLSGSARSLAALPVAIAGKTGTAQVGGDQASHAWFTCYAPYENPEIVITVLIENGGEGSTSALPVAKEVLQWYFDKENRN